MKQKDKPTKDGEWLVWTDRYPEYVYRTSLYIGYPGEMRGELTWNRSQPEIEQLALRGGVLPVELMLAWLHGQKSASQDASMGGYD